MISGGPESTQFLTSNMTVSEAAKLAKPEFSLEHHKRGKTADAVRVDTEDKEKIVAFVDKHRSLTHTLR